MNSTTEMADTEQTPPRVVLSGGGTGGHVYPALAVAGALRRLCPDCELLYIGGDRLEARVVPAAGMAFRAISVHGIAGRGMSALGRRARALAEIGLGIPVTQSLRILREFRPHVIVGTGGYVSGPVILAARLLRVPSLALEGNRTPGWTSRTVSRLVDAMAVAYPELAEFFSPRVRAGVRVELTGLPLREPIGTNRREEAARALDLDPSLTTVLALGGSLGSRRINDALLGALTELSARGDVLRDVQVLHVTGPRYSAPQRTGQSPLPRYHALPYLDEQYPDALAAADLVVSRAGASTVAEIAACGLPAVLIPWSKASTGEQALNAEPLARAGAAAVIADGELTPRRLADVLSDLLQNREKRAAMAEASRSLGRPHAAEAVARLALDLARQRFRA